MAAIILDIPKILYDGDLIASQYNFIKTLIARLFYKIVLYSYQDDVGSPVFSEKCGNTRKIYVKHLTAFMVIHRHPIQKKYKIMHSQRFRFC